MEEATNVLFRIGPLEVTSTVTTMWAIVALLALVSFLATRNLREEPGVLQTAAEMAVGALRNFFEGTLGREHTRKYFPILGTFFVFIIVCNYSGLLPGAGHIRGFALPTASLSVTAGLAIVAFFTTHRLYGNMYGEENVTEQLYGIFPVLAPLIMQVLSLIFCLLQAVVFTMLLSIYISEALEEE